MLIQLSTQFTDLEEMKRETKKLIAEDKVINLSFNGRFSTGNEGAKTFSGSVSWQEERES